MNNPNNTAEAVPSLSDAKAMCQRLEAEIDAMEMLDANCTLSANELREAAAFIRSLQQRNAGLEEALTKDIGRSPAGRATHEPGLASRPGHSVSVPNADALVSLMSAWSSIPAHKFHRAYPFFDGDRQRVISEYSLVDDERARLEATALLFAEYADEIYAQGIEARQGGDGETRLHRNDESPVGETDAPKDSASPTPQHKE